MMMQTQTSPTFHYAWMRKKGTRAQNQTDAFSDEG